MYALGGNDCQNMLAVALTHAYHALVAPRFKHRARLIWPRSQVAGSRPDERPRRRVETPPKTLRHLGSAARSAAMSSAKQGGARQTDRQAAALAVYGAGHSAGARAAGSGFPPGSAPRAASWKPTSRPPAGSTHAVVTCAVVASGPRGAQRGPTKSMHGVAKQPSGRSSRVSTMTSADSPGSSALRQCQASTRQGSISVSSCTD